MAKFLISVGGVGTIAAVTLIFVFLVWVVVPLFRGADHDDARHAAVAANTNAPLAIGNDEYRRLAFALDPSGELVVWRTDDGAQLEKRTLFPDGRLTAVAQRDSNGDMAFGFADGSVRLGRIAFSARFVDASAQPEIARQLESTQLAVVGNALVERTPDGQLRMQSIDVDAQPALSVGLKTAVVALDRSTHGGSTSIAAIDTAGTLVVTEIERRENLLTGDVTLDVHDHVLTSRPRGEGLPERLLLSGGGDALYLAWNDGILQRYDVRDPAAAALAEELDLVDGEGTLTALTFLLGKTTLISGDSRGRVRGWFGTKPLDAKTRDGIRLVRTHDLCTEGTGVAALAASSRGRVVCAGFDDGALRMYHVTSHKLLFETRVANEAKVAGLAIAPKEDGLVALSGRELSSWRMSLRHPEATLGALFTPVWYEGYAEPEHVWQSTGGTDDFEPKLGLWPLVFGTLKATFYSMLFGAPLALLAALFTSEFLHKKLKGPLKSLTEMMASLPSVVLGFIAAIIIAPLVQGFVPVVLALFFTVPFALLLGAYLWQLLPQRAYIRWSGGPRFAVMCLCLPAGVVLAIVLGPFCERAFFAGDIGAWLSGARGNAVGGWLLLLLPLSVLAYVVFAGRVLDPWLRRISATWDRGRASRFDLLKFGIASFIVFLLAFGAAHAFDSAGLDPRGGVLDTYVQRNALIVGFVMGFAIVPIIYTLAEDALSSVPAHLRLASLGAGATPWQTAVRVVIPTAMSGLFSAVMIGLGRAVGETMIVLMATGNTPVMSWNIFDGFRTLSANIAVELPEAVRDSTHYRTLFLAAFCLFALTFVLNTFAELVRQRFRKRAYQL